MRHVLCAAGLLACPAVAVAQQSVPAALSLADAIAIAREQNPAYRQALNNRGPAAWGTRSAYSSLLLPSVTVSGGVTYSGPGQQRFLTADFSQTVATLSSSYNVGLSYELSGAVLSQPGLKRAQENAAEADISGAATSLVTAVTQQYLTVLQARRNADVARRQLDRNEEFLKLAQARYAVGRATVIDVRQAQVARGQAEVALLRAQTQVSVEKLRLFEQLGVTAPVDVETVQLTDTFAVLTPTWSLNELLTMAEAQNPSLRALRAREGAAGWGVKAAASSYGPTLSLSAIWSGFTQKYTELDPIIRGQQGAYGQQYRAPVSRRTTAASTCGGAPTSRRCAARTRSTPSRSPSSRSRRGSRFRCRSSATSRARPSSPRRGRSTAISRSRCGRAAWRCTRR